MIAYIETSAAAKLLISENESRVLKQWIDEFKINGGSIVSSPLLETELRRTAIRQNAPQTTGSEILDRLDIAELDRSVFTQAGILSGANLRSLDALHVAAALGVNADVMISYDQRQLDAAEAAGLRVHSPR